MKLFYLGPNIRSTMSEESIDVRTRAAVEPIVDLILGYFRAEGVETLIGLSTLNAPIDEILPTNQPRPPHPSTGTNQERFGRYVVTRFQSESEVRAALIGMGDCYEGVSGFFCIRSIISCRAVTYGYDGQAFLCLHVEDAPPVALDPELVWIEERPDILSGTDYLDGVAVIEDW